MRLLRLAVAVVEWPLPVLGEPMNGGLRTEPGASLMQDRPWRVKSRAINELVRAADQFAAWDTLQDRPLEDFGLIVTAEAGETDDPIPIHTSALMFSWCRDDDALRLIEVAIANDLGDTEIVDRENGAEIARKRWIRNG